MAALVSQNRDENRDRAIEILSSGGQVVMPTDTIYGIVASALLPLAVERVFEVRQRDLHKPVIILIADEADLERFSIVRSREMQAFLCSVWPGAVSVVLSAEDSRYEYLHRGTRTLAFRLPADSNLRAFLRQSGPLIAPSANIAGQPPATTIDEARQYFGSAVKLYIDSGKRECAPSTLVRWTPESVTLLRQGSVIVDSRHLN